MASLCQGDSCNEGSGRFMVRLEVVQKTEWKDTVFVYGSHLAFLGVLLHVQRTKHPFGNSFFPACSVYSRRLQACDEIGRRYRLFLVSYVLGDRTSIPISACDWPFVYWNQQSAAVFIPCDPGTMGRSGAPWVIPNLPSCFIPRPGASDP